MKSYQIALLAMVGNGVLFASLLLYAYAQHTGSLAFINWSVLGVGTLLYGLALSALAWFGGWLINVLLVYPKKPIRNYALSEGWVGALFFFGLLALVLMSATTKDDPAVEKPTYLNLGAIGTKYLYGSSFHLREFHTVGYAAPAEAVPEGQPSVEVDGANSPVVSGDPQPSTVLIHVKDTVLKKGGDTLHMIYFSYPLKDRQEWYSKVDVVHDTAHVQVFNGFPSRESVPAGGGHRH